jgi:hypothetical protein
MLLVSRYRAGVRVLNEREQSKVWSAYLIAIQELWELTRFSGRRASVMSKALQERIKILEQQLAEATLQNFSCRHLSSTTSLGMGAILRPVEAAYQDEFYCTLCLVLGFSGKVSSKWSGDNSGRINFWLPEVKWGIEILREGDRLGEYCKQFVDNGSYTSWIQNGWITDWLIVREFRFGTVQNR